MKHSRFIFILIRCFLGPSSSRNSRQGSRRDSQTGLDEGGFPAPGAHVPLQQSAESDEFLPAQPSAEYPRAVAPSYASASVAHNQFSFSNESSPTWRGPNQSYSQNRGGRQSYRERQQQGYGHQQPYVSNQSQQGHQLSHYVFGNIPSAPVPRFRGSSSPYANGSSSSPAGNTGNYGNSIQTHRNTNFRPDRPQIQGPFRRQHTSPRFPFDGAVASAPVSPVANIPMNFDWVQHPNQAISINPLAPPIGSPILPELPLTSSSFYFFRAGFGQLLVGLLPRFFAKLIYLFVLHLADFISSL